MKFEYLFFIAAGLFSIAGAVFEWKFFVENGKARSLARIVGRTGTRIFYIVIGIILIGLGVWLLLV